MAQLGGTIGRNDEVIAIDDGSADSTESTCQNFLAVIWRIKWFATSANTGYSRAVNHGIEGSTGNTLPFLNPDTEVYPG
ncbi:MAG: glycosyltransferase [Armatimonadetes bacterium]|nr:glycosyltransferase [Armatimonadota bacterium]MBX3107810.1 glycosyltransferase [Fimbriimonadaceae bacterium]